MKQKFIKENEILLLNEGKNYKLTLKLKNKEKIVLNVKEENSLTNTSAYERVFCLNELPRRNDDITIHNMQAVLKAINSSSKTNQLDFFIESKYIILSYVLYEEKNEINIPLYYSLENKDLMYNLSSDLSEAKKKLRQF